MSTETKCPKHGYKGPGDLSCETCIKLVAYYYYKRNLDILAPDYCWDYILAWRKGEKK